MGNLEVQSQGGGTENSQQRSGEEEVVGNVDTPCECAAAGGRLGTF